MQFGCASIFFLSRKIILSRNSRNSRKRRGCAMILLDILEELGCCAALDFAVRCFSFGVFFLTEFTERTEFFYSRTRCLTSSNALDGTHGNVVAAPACHSELVSPTNFTNVYRYAIGFISHRLHRFKRFFILIIRFAFLLRKRRSVDLHGFFWSCDRADTRAVRPYKGVLCM